MKYYVYILASKKNGTLYVGITNNLENRIFQHKNKKIRGFSQKYNINKLMYYEEYASPFDAITREKNIKKWKRSWKIKLIMEYNSGWNDLSKDWYLDGSLPMQG